MNFPPPLSKPCRGCMPILMNVCAEATQTGSPVPLNSPTSHVATTTVMVGSGGNKKRKFRGSSQKMEKSYAMNFETVVAA
jgi:hypothetical protein